MLVGGWILVVSGLVHVVVWAVLGGPWEGPLAWRKPILFGISTGVTLWSLAWLLPLLRPLRGDVWLSRVLSTSLVVEVALITLQTWRGVPSHFNRATPFDASVGEAAQWLVWLASFIIAYLTVRSLFPLQASLPMKLAIRGGMLLLLVGCALGFWTAMAGDWLMSQQLAAEIIPPRGVLKFPHGMAMHAIQFLPIVAWLSRFRDLDQQRSMRVVQLATASVTLGVLYSFVQTLAGRPRFDGSLPIFLIALASGFVGFLSMIELLRPISKEKASAEPSQLARK